MKNIITDELKDAIQFGVESGRFWANCPKCTIPLSCKELKRCKCGTCGKIKYEDIKLVPKTDMC